MITIQKISAETLYPIRHEILRKGEPIEKCIYPNDNAESTFHLGLYDNNDLAGVISVFKTTNSIFSDDNQFQIRGMAVLDAYRKKGYGAKLVREAEAYLQKHQSNHLIWFNARIIAIGFYEKLGYVKIGEPFEIEPIGIHYIMYKRM